MNNTSRQPQIGDVFSVRLDGKGSEQNGYRPCLILQNNLGNAYSPNVIVIPLTSHLKKVNQPTHVILPAKETGLERDSMALCENPVSVSKERLGVYRTTIPHKHMAQIAEASTLATSVIAFLNPDVLLSLWQRATSLNATSVA